jgi:DNA-binding transcriptional regulator YdaS (Cro superfamily)
MNSSCIEADWLAVLRAQVQRTSQTRMALKLGVSTSVVSQVLSGTYKANTLRLERRVRGVLMGEGVECPVLWDLPMQACQDLQERRGSLSNEHQQQAWFCCRGAGRFEDRGPCIHFNGAGAGAAAADPTNDSPEDSTDRKDAS